MSRRAAGLLLHPTSLPDDPGGLEASARSLLAWMEAARLRVWQILPIGPPGPGRSPYSSPSAFAGGPSLFAPAGEPEARALAAFGEAHAAWLDDWCLFAALREERQRPWTEWDAPLRRRDPGALARAARDLAEPVARHRRAQLAFFDAWTRVREEAQRRGIAILGDVPIYPALDSADVWSHQDLFWLDEDGRPSKVAGVPPDYFSSDGQLWGNPLYRWELMRERGYAWWIARLRHALVLHDRLRLDHFRGFAGYWAVPAGAPTARDGAWEPGPGAPLFDALREALGALPFVAEDLGLITEDVVRLRRDMEIPGMRVLQFAFGAADGEHMPHRIPADSVVYTGTHDNDTARGWFASLDAAGKGRVLDYVGGAPEEIAWSLIRVALTSAADLAIVPAQDVFALGSEARMNVPGVAAGNWSWRARAADFTPERAERLARLVDVAGRC
ncbi:MAG TPA: 4-alpha-glucanotransferase [Candidatus Polarisedimenticolaceae bacterium]|nr:4-alpha-glucanotransferase [Candidatus Polarisedimenticolaceae bacterium]